MTGAVRIGWLLAAALSTMTLMSAQASGPLPTAAAPSGGFAPIALSPHACRGGGISLSRYGSGGGGSLSCGGAPVEDCGASY